MRASMIVLALVVGVGGCHRSSERERRATTEAEEEASETTITSAVLDAGDTEAEAVVALRKQELHTRVELERALDALDRKRKTARKRGAAHVKAVDAERDLLKKDLDALDSVSDDDWASLKAKIDRDLREHGS